MKRKATAMMAAGVGMGLGLGVGLIFPAAAAAAIPNTMQGCLACHQAESNVIRGKSVTHSEKFGTIQIDVGPLVRIVKFDQETLVKGADSLAGLGKDKEIAITFTGDEKTPVATTISIKEPFELPAEKLVSVEEMQALVAKGPEKGGYLLVDSRPPAAYLEGHVPGAISIPFPALQNKKEALLPADKDLTLIFYCGGFV